VSFLFNPCPATTAIEMHPSLTTLSLARDVWRAHSPGGVGVDEILALVDVLPNTKYVSTVSTYSGLSGSDSVFLFGHVCIFPQTTLVHFTFTHPPPANFTPHSLAFLTPSNIPSRPYLNNNNNDDDDDDNYKI
jgi:hypothetical protein